jgi:pyruvyltransferase
MRELNVYASSTGAIFGAQPENYGDNLMTPLLRELFGIEPRYVDMERAELIGAGSIIDCFHRRRSTWERLIKRRPWQKLHVWGSGFMNETGKALWPQTLTFHAVRGPLSRDKLRLPSLPMGDPALLLPKIWAKPPVGAAVALIPHFITYRDFVDAYANDLPKHWRIVDLLGSPEAITREIASAEVVISSSLHGLIVADAYSVPSIRMKGDRRIKGDGFKFRDYELFRSAGYGEPVSVSDIMVGQLKPNEPKPVSDGQVAALLQSFPFA